MNIQWIIAPLVGCVIGYITNAIAIRMLFRPHEEHRIGRFRVPFTPGLIPRNRGRLAAAVGDTISRELLNREVVEQTLLSEDMERKITDTIEAAVQSLRQNESTVQELLIAHVDAEALDEWLLGAEAYLASMIHQKLIGMDLGGMAARAVNEHALRKTPTILSGLINTLLDENRRHSVASQLRDGINEYIEQNGAALIQTTLASGVEHVKQARVDQTIERIEPRIPEIEAGLISGYRQVVRAGTHRALSALDIAEIVRARVESFDSRTIEQIVFSVMNRELKAIVWLGALLGFVMGFVNLLFT